jgi:hypothetical protein
MGNSIKPASLTKKLAAARKRIADLELTIRRLENPNIEAAAKRGAAIFEEKANEGCFRSWGKLSQRDKNAWRQVAAAILQESLKSPGQGAIGRDGRALQPIEFAKDGCLRFRKNAIVCLLLDNGGFDMNRLWLMEFSKSDWTQFYQLIGYSVSGFYEISKVSEEAKDLAEAISANLMP